ncbi:MAG: hypothetical protein ACRDU5_08355 [Mycobacterium sp.]
MGELLAVPATLVFGAICYMSGNRQPMPGRELAAKRCRACPPM